MMVELTLFLKSLPALAKLMMQFMKLSVQLIQYAEKIKLDKTLAELEGHMDSLTKAESQDDKKIAIQNISSTIGRMF